MTRTALVHDEQANELVSEAAGLAYPIRDGIPVMLVEEARKL
ncbi:Trm112 family protein [Sphingorhabdus sp. SMR4y]|nr:Trm112 family protein [Sphingorhabdus sp. SMR4y]